MSPPSHRNCAMTNSYCMTTNQQYVRLVEKLLQNISTDKSDQILPYFFSGVEETFVLALVNAIKPYTNVHWLQDCRGEQSAIVILLLHGQEYAFCEFQLSLEAEEWRIHNVILRPLEEKEPILFIGELLTQASE